MLFSLLLLPLNKTVFYIVLHEVMERVNCVRTGHMSLLKCIIRYNDKTQTIGHLNIILVFQNTLDQYFPSRHSLFFHESHLSNLKENTCTDSS